MIIRWICGALSCEDIWCGGNWGCDEKMQPEVAWTCGKKGRCRLCERLVVVERKAPVGRLRKTWQNTPSTDMALLKVAQKQTLESGRCMLEGNG